MGEGGGRRGRPRQLERTYRETGCCTECLGTANATVAYGMRCSM